MTALEIARRVRSGQLSAREVIEATLAAADGSPTNAFTSLDDQALDRASTIDDLVAAGTDPGPLAGVPVAAKDLVDHAGRVTTAGSAFYRHLAETTAPALARLEEAGAVVIGRAGLHEFAFGFNSENEWFGPVRNPWDLDTSPGGSSGGSAAAVAAGLVPLAVGTDTGGSVRVPAALCGVAGLKVTHGRIPLEGVFPLAPSLDTVGPLAADVTDLDLAYRVLAGVPDHSAVPDGGLDSLRLLVPDPWVGQAPLSPPVAEAFSGFLAAVADRGAEVAYVTLPELLPPGLSAEEFGPEVAAVHREWRQGGQPYGGEVADRIDRAMAVEPDTHAEAHRWRAALTAAVGGALEGGALLATPTVPALVKHIGYDDIDGKSHRVVLSWFTALVNQTGCPALALPLAAPPPGPPPSLQLIGDRGDEARLLAVGAVLEAAGLIGGGRQPPVFWSGPEGS